MAADELKSLEMRVAELEDRLKGLSFTADELAAYQKVASGIGPGHGQPAPGTCWGHFICWVCSPYSITFHPPGWGPGPATGEQPGEGFGELGR